MVPISSSKARVTILVFPLSKEDLEAQHPHARKASFPGLELMQCDVDLFPLANSETGKNWGCPLTPLIHLGGTLTDNNCIPPTDELKACISATLRATLLPTTKRDVRTLSAAWQAIQESGTSKLREKVPDSLWPHWTRAQETQQGM